MIHMARYAAIELLSVDWKTAISSARRATDNGSVETELAFFMTAIYRPEEASRDGACEGFFLNTREPLAYPSFDGRDCVQRMLQEQARYLETLARPWTCG
jgi:hypothetical protein